MVLNGTSEVLSCGAQHAHNDSCTNGIHDYATNKL